MKRMTTLILCAALLLSMAGCTRTPADDPTTAPKESPAKSAYAQARDTLDDLAHVTLNVLITTFTTVDGDAFSEHSVQTLTYQEKGKETAVILMEETPEFGVHTDESDTEEDQTEPIHYKEIWHQGTVYAEVDSTHRYQSAVDADAAAKRYTPVVLLNADLYSNITSENTDDGMLIRFASPSAGETWAIPQDAKLEDASGTALINTKGNLAEMNYTVTYTYGSSRVTKTIQSKPFDYPQTIVPPSDPNAYSPISYIDALRMYVSAYNNLMQTDSLILCNTESLLSEAGAVTQDQTLQANLHGQKENTIAKLDTSIYFTDHTSMESEEYHLEETFLDGKLTSVTNSGLPTTDSSVSWKDVRSYVVDMIVDGMPGMDHWKDVSVTDMGSILFLEFQLNENFGNTIQNYICNLLWSDPSFLINLASKYEATELNGYLSIDKYTGLPVAAGYFYQAAHTIEGQDYAMSLQFDQSIESPAKGAYQAICGQLPAEEEPESKPTPLFYRVTGENGQEMWLFGTIHVGDERTAYLPEEIRNAFAASDALALECNTERFEEQLEKDDKLAEQVSGLYFYTDGTEVIKISMDADDYAYAQKLLKAVGANNINMPYAKPYLWSNAIEQFYLRQGYQLHSDQGVEARLLAWAQEQNKEILEIESSLKQLQMSAGFSKELQLLMLEEAIAYDGQEYWEYSMSLYEMWCSGNEEDLRKEISNEFAYMEMTEEELTKYKPLLEEYGKAMSTDRNKHMLDVAVDYLESGKTVFYAVGLAHLLDDATGLVTALQNAGYTVQQVTFAS